MVARRDVDGPPDAAVSIRSHDLARRAARCRRTSRGGRHAGEHVVAAARAVYTKAIADGLLGPGASPAHRVVKPRRLPSTRCALNPDELEQINLVARTPFVHVESSRTGHAAV